MEKKKLAIFDLDGTLFDTKNVNFNAYSKALEKCGFQETIDYQYYCTFCNGNNYKTFLPEIVKGISDEEMKAVHNEKKIQYKYFIGLARKNEHLFSIIELMRDEYLTALVTTASKANTTDILSEFDVANRFDFIITQEDVTHTKPNPECFELALKSAGADKENAIIFEDSETGLKAAEASGISYVKVYGYN